jgi:hypothetical protein
VGHFSMENPGHVSVEINIFFAKLEEYGARGRNRTTDTRIFNGDGNRFLFYYINLTWHIFSVCKSVFLVI